MPSRIPVSEPLALLCAMQNLGITRREQAISVESLAFRTGLSLEKVRSTLASLVVDGLVMEVKDRDAVIYYLTTRGILTAVSVFS